MLNNSLVNPALEDEKHMLDEVPNTLPLEPSHVDTTSVASNHTALTEPANSAKVIFIKIN